MIGNDIIDLDLVQRESNWQRKGFLDKIFTQSEQLLISSTSNQEIMVWNLWSRKEAAYKIYNRQTKIRGYFPLQLECSDLSIINGIIFGKVTIDNFCYFTKTEITDQFVYTISVENRDDFDKIKILKNRKNILKEQGIPSVFDDNQLAFKPVSISHHGRFEQIISL